MSYQKPNILLIMSDEHAPQYSSIHGHPLVQSPHMDRLASMGITFDNAYCNSPLCGPSRMSFMTGRYVHNNGCYDNGSPLGSDAVTWAHRLRDVGYDVVISGKQHFCGLDQLHGFRTQLGRDLHAEQWTTDGIPRGAADWDEGIVEGKPWGGVEAAGPGSTTSIEVDDQVEAAALSYIRDPARKDQPWAINVGFIAPHFPLVVPERFYDLYPLDDIDLPEIPDGHLDNLHPVHQRMRRMFGCVDFPEEAVRRARAGYYGLITYLDEKIGRLIDALEETGQLRNTIIINTSDHGEMNGEHGMWRKSNHYEASARVPLQIAWPGTFPDNKRVSQNVSLVDLVATLIDVTWASRDVAPLDGESLRPLIEGEEPGWKDEAFSEYLAHGVEGPVAMLKRGDYKLNVSLGDAPQMFNIAEDPNEFTDLADDPEHKDIQKTLHRRLIDIWGDPLAIEQDVIRSQRERRFITGAPS
ncbi:TPA: choline-sulfatase [Candidatus Latescibacteria bacterium]|nr:choline-sulfatase [Candidatus Latescibacterota bacterium]